MSEKHLLFRCHGEDAQDHAQLACEFVKGYFDLWNQRVKMTSEAYEYPGREESGAPIPYDVFIETANQHTADIAHAAGWSYLTAREVNAKVENLKKNGGETQ